MCSYCSLCKCPDTLFSFGLLIIHIFSRIYTPTRIRWKAYQWTMQLDLKRLGSHCKGCGCTKNQHDAIQFNVKEAISQEFQIWNFRAKIPARPSHILSIAWISWSTELPIVRYSIYLLQQENMSFSRFILSGRMCGPEKDSMCGEGFRVGSIYSSRFHTLALGHRHPF